MICLVSKHYHKRSNSSIYSVYWFLVNYRLWPWVIFSPFWCMFPKSLGAKSCAVRSFPLKASHMWFILEGGGSGFVPEGCTTSTLYLTYHRVWVCKFHDAHPFNRPFFLQTPYVRLIFIHRLFELKSLHYLSRFGLCALAPTNQPDSQRFSVLCTSFAKFHRPYPGKQCEKRNSLQPPYLGGFRQYNPSLSKEYITGSRRKLSKLRLAH